MFGFTQHIVRNLISILSLLLFFQVANAAPIASFTVSSTIVCSGQPITVTSTSTGTITSYNWNFGSGAAPATANSIGPHTISYTSPGLKTISLTVSGPDGSSTEILTDIIQVNAIPAAPGNITGPESVCSGATAVTYSVSPVQYANTYNWTLPNGSVVTSGAGTNQIQISFGSAAGNICVNAQNSCGTGNNTCKAINVGKERIKLVSYNLLNYPDLNRVTADTTERNPFFRTIIAGMEPDILVTQETQSQAGVSGFLSNVMNRVSSGYSAGTFIDGFDTDNAIFYKNSKFTFISNTRIRTTLRDINEFKLVHLLSGDTLRIYSVHLKASNTTSDEAQRSQEVDTLRKYTNLLPSGSNFIVCGDFNIYRSSEAAYQKLLQIISGTEGHVIDPIPISGTWNSSVFAQYHTQSPRLRSFGGGATGGLNDRFDMVLYSNAISQPGGISYVTGSTIAFGNDGNHYNDSINQSPNTAVSQAMADALHYAADHLPVSILLDFENTSCPFADVGATAIVEPSSITCTNQAQSVVVKIKNFGGNTLNFSYNNLTVNLIATAPNGLIQSLSQILTSGTLGGGQETDVIFNTPLALIDTGDYLLKSFTALPGDTIPTNDTTNTFVTNVYKNADALITTSGNTTFCAGGSVLLSAVFDSSTTYQWQNNSVDIIGATTSDYMADSSGSYQLVLQKTNTISTTYPSAIFRNTTTYSIPNNSCTGASSTINVTGYNGLVSSSNISIKVNITHTAVGDLVLYLESPNGQRLGLSNRTGNTGNTGDNFTNTIFSDNGTVSIPSTGAPYSGTYKPWPSIFSSCVSSTITSFGAIGNGIINPNGSWKLLAYDRASGNSGSIVNWEITFPAYSATTVLTCSPLLTNPVNVTSVTPPQISLSPANGSICTGGSVQLTATGAATYSWNPTNGLNTSTGATVTATPAVATQYTVTGTDANGCTGTATVSLSLNTPPVVTFSSLNTVCVNSAPFALNGGAPVGGTYSGPGVASGNFNPQIAGVGNHIITYSFTDANGCTSTATSTITVRSLPPATTSPSGAIAICQGSNLTITTNPGFTYLWSNGNTNQSIDVNSAGSYNVTLTDNAGCSAISPSVNVSLSSFQASGELFTETIGTVSTTTSISSHENANGFDNDQFTMSGTADIRATTASNGYTGASGGANVFFTTIAGRNFIISGINTIGLNNLQLSFGIYKNTNAATGSDFQVQVSSDGINFTPLNYSALPTGTGTAVWHYRTISTGIPTTSNLSIQFIQNSTTNQYRIDDVKLTYAITSPSISSIGSTSVCQGGSVTLTASPSASYLWNDGATTQSIIATTSGTRFCTVTGSNGCVATTNSIAVNVNPSLFIVSGGGTICAGDSGLPIGITGSESGVSYQLQRDGSFIGSQLAGTGSALQFGLQSLAGNYTVFATHSPSGCTATMTGSATIQSATSPITYTVTGGGDYCHGSTSPPIELSGSQPNVTYRLFRTGNPSPIALLIGNGGSISFGNQSITGSYFVQATDNSSGCSILMNGNITINELPGPIVYTMTGGGGICAGSTGLIVGLNNSEVGVYYSLIRNGNLTSTVLNGTGTAISFGQQSAGIYTVLATAMNGCTASMVGSAIVQQLSLPLSYSVTGGGNNCELATTGIPIGINGSDVNVSYQLLLNGSPVAGNSVSGTGAALSFGDFFTAGVYEVLATKLSTGCTLLMNGSAVLQVTSASRWFQDADQDGFGDASAVITDCTPPTGFTTDSTDCNDAIFSSNPGAIELCGNGIDDNCNGQIDEGCSLSLTVKLFLDGFYRGNGRLAAVANPLSDSLHCDTITVSLCSSTAPYQAIFSQQGVISTNGNLSINVPSTINGGNYFIRINHRNCLETWSATTIALNSSSALYDFTLSANSAYGNNLKSLGDGFFAIYSGDVNQDGMINIIDVQLMEYGVGQFLAGYHPNELTGDQVTESSDGSLMENNAAIGIAVIRP